MNSRLLLKHSKHKNPYGFRNCMVLSVAGKRGENNEF